MRQELASPGPYRSERELSLGRSVDFLKTAPTYVVGFPGSISPSIEVASSLLVSSRGIGHRSKPPMTETPPSLAPLAAAKADLRRVALARRDGLDPEARHLGAEALARSDALPAIAPGTVVAGYFPIRSEIDPRPLMRRLATAGVRLALPVVGDDRVTMVFRVWHEGDALEPASFGLSVPPARAGEVEPDVLLMPLAAFDGAGHRIGYGKGHYDRALDRLESRRPRLKIGLAFACQRVDGVPAEAHDRRLDLILTETGAITPRIPSSE